MHCAFIPYASSFLLWLRESCPSRKGFYFTSSARKASSPTATWLIRFLSSAFPTESKNKSDVRSKSHKWGKTIARNLHPLSALSLQHLSSGCCAPACSQSYVSNSPPVAAVLAWTGQALWAGRPDRCAFARPQAPCALHRRCCSRRGSRRPWSSSEPHLSLSAKATLAQRSWWLSVGLVHLQFWYIDMKYISNS